MFTRFSLLLQAINVGVYYYFLIVLNGLLIANLFPATIENWPKILVSVVVSLCSLFRPLCWCYFCQLIYGIQSLVGQLYPVHKQSISQLFCNLHFLQFFRRNQPISIVCYLHRRNIGIVCVFIRRMEIHFLFLSL